MGYPIVGRKTAVVRIHEKSEFSVYEENEPDKVVFRGELIGPQYVESSKESIYVADFSGLEKEGQYVLQIMKTGYKETFAIGTGAYDPLKESCLKFFYLQRCGCPITKEFGGLHAHEKCHTQLATIYGTDMKKEVSGGWHDAGDFGRYVDPAAVTIADLILARKINNKAMDVELNIPETCSKLPDVMAEIKYEIEWMLKMQDPATGMVYHKVSCAQFHGFAKPEEEKEELILSPFSVTSTATFAAVMAMCAHAYEDDNETLSKDMMRAAVRAYKAMKKMDMPGGFTNPPDIQTGEYGDAIDTDERYWAAASLFHATGEQEYRKDFEALAKERIYHGYGWQDVGSFGNIAYITARFEKDEQLVNQIKKEMIDTADTILMEVSSDPYGTGVKQYAWGSNYYVSQRGNQLIDAYILTKDEKYKAAALEEIHYLLGRNPNGYCYVTGFGTTSPEHPHHRVSEAVKKAMPGMLVGGPDDGLHDPDAQNYCKDKPPAQCYVDVLGSYSTNEVTIYWNAAFIRLLVSVL